MSPNLDPLSAEPSLLSLILRPHRSLSRYGFIWLMAAVMTVYALVGGYFFSIGAWPVFGFMGAEILLLYLLFRLNYRDGRAFETVDLTQSRLAIEKVDPRGQAERHEFQPHWLRVEMDDPPERHSQLSIGSHGRSLTLGSFLTPPERLEVAGEIRAGLRKVRYGGG
ncbi:MAG: DUF2244 domain-containing protein, partial [Rhodospirillales bacterium]